jgi:hypothetical protein
MVLCCYISQFSSSTSHHVTPLEDDAERLAGMDLDFMSLNLFIPSTQYRLEAIMLLKHNFPYISSRALFSFFQSPQICGRYSIFHEKVVSCIIEENTIFGTTSIDGVDASVIEIDIQWKRLKQALVHKNLDAAQKAHMQSLKLFLPNKRLSIVKYVTWARSSANLSQPNIKNPLLKAEIVFVEEKMHDILLLKERAYRRRMKNAQIVLNSTDVECLCCCDRYDRQEMISCVKGEHSSCIYCLQAYVENQLFGVGNFGFELQTKQLHLELVCFCSTDCSSGFDRKQLDAVLPKKLMKKYDEVQFTICLERCGIKDEMVSCPRCEYRASLPTYIKYFTCPHKSCKFQSCRVCGEKPHELLQCRKVEEEHVTLGRLIVEEAISASKIRNCPSCKKPFIKR